jgi:transcriptional regulator with GAF, ATPase, and Fis domain
MSDTELLEQFYQCLLALAYDPYCERTLDEAMRLIAAVTGAQLTFVEILDPQQIPRYWRGYHADKRSLDAIRFAVSRGIIAQAIAERRIITTTSQLDAGQSSNVVSIECAKIAFVLCVPIEAPACTGVLYLQTLGGPFSSTDCERIELLASTLANVPALNPAAAAAPTSTMTLHEETRVLQVRRVHEAVTRCEGNISKAARELGVSRAFVYGVMHRRA